MPERVVEITRTVRLAIPGAVSGEDARHHALDIAWQWLPEEAEGGDQGSATAGVVRHGDLPSDGGETVEIHEGPEGEDVLANADRISREYPDGVHTCADLQRLEPGRRPCTCGRCGQDGERAL